MSEFSVEIRPRQQVSSHPLENLEFKCQLPDGTRIELRTGRYLDFTSVNSGESNWTMGIAPFVGSWAPDNPLESLNDIPPFEEFVVVRVFNPVTYQALTQLVRISLAEDADTPRIVRYGKVIEQEGIREFNEGFASVEEKGSGIIAVLRKEMNELMLPANP